MWRLRSGIEAYGLVLWLISTACANPSTTSPLLVDAGEECPSGPCIVVSPCDIENGGCDLLTSCTSDADGGVVCGACPTGYAGSGIEGCGDINECAVGNGGCRTDQVCDNYLGSSRCRCPAGRVDDGQACAGSFQSIAATLGQTCGVLFDGSLWCWGLPVGKSASTATPNGWQATPQRADQRNDWAIVDLSLGFAALTTSGGQYRWLMGPAPYETSQSWANPCGLKNDGTLWSRGASGMGTLQRVGTDTWSKVSCGYGRCGIRTDGTLWCWREGNALSIVFSSAIPAGAGPFQLGTDTTWVDVSTSPTQICAVRRDGRLYCGGSIGNTHISPPSGRAELTQMAGDGYSSVNVDHDVACTLKKDGRLFCWGANERGQFGIGSQDSSLVPVEAGPGHQWVSVAVASDHVCALERTGKAWCWGANGGGQLGSGSAGSQMMPVLLGQSDEPSGYWVESGYSCVKNANEGVACAGSQVSQLVARTSPPPTQTRASLPFDGIVSLTNGGRETFAVRADGSLWALNGAPERIGTADDWALLASGGSTACGIKTSGVVACWQGWSRNEADMGVLPMSAAWTSLVVGTDLTCGLSTTGDVVCMKDLGSAPFQFGETETVAAANWTALTLGYNHLCALNTAGAASCQRFRSGLGAFEPVDESDWVSLASSNERTCGVQTNGSLWCWQVGLTAPSRVDAATDWESVKADTTLWNFCARKQDHTVWCWGSNDFGQLGTGTAWRLEPVAVAPF